jgi:hypothetical protein
MNLQKLFNNAYNVKAKRNWDRLYIAIDLHDTIIPSSYETENILTMFDGAKEVLQEFTKDEEIVLILFTSSYKKLLQPMFKLFKDNDIHFDYLNENPLEPSTETGNFADKFYYNILLDDKAGFEPATDWEETHRVYKKCLNCY